jgi:hypothetical protein
MFDSKKSTIFSFYISDIYITHIRHIVFQILLLCCSTSDNCYKGKKGLQLHGLPTRLVCVRILFFIAFWPVKRGGRVLMPPTK